MATAQSADAFPRLLARSWFKLAEPKIELSPTEELLARYRRYLLETRGLAETSARGYVDMVRSFVVDRSVDDQLDWASMRPADVIAFVRSACRDRSTGSAKLLITALRSLLSYVHIEGLIAKPLSAAVPSIAGSKLATLPRGLEAGEVDRLLAACDRRTRKGRRDFAMLMLLARLGLRAGEVRTLSLDDLDWHAGELIVRRWCARECPFRRSAKSSAVAGS